MPAEALRHFTADGEGGLLPETKQTEKLKRAYTYHIDCTIRLRNQP
jgi:hypothetical protein